MILPQPRESSDLAPRLTRCLNGMTHFAGPAQRMQEGAPHVAPEVRDDVLGGVALVRVHQPQTAANNGVYDGHAGPAHMFGVHHLHTHSHSEGGPHALRQLGERTLRSVAAGQRC